MKVKKPSGYTATLFTLLILSACQVLSGCQGQELTEAVPEILGVYPHDPEAFTQGLLLEDGRFYESTGLYGESTLREVVPETGEVLREVAVSPDIFAEGLTLVEDKLIQITWREGVALIYDRDTFEQTDTLSYEGEGWGLCYDGAALVMSDGSATLTRRDPATLAVLGATEVTLDGQPVTQLNELECVGDDVYANVWQTDTIVRIADSGQVTQEIDASSLLSDAERAGLGPNAVLNGIAYDAEAETFFLTGKLWPKVLEVRFTKL